MRNITKIEPKMVQIRRKKQVAAYARVSMDTDRLRHSISAQISWYSTLIQKNTEWEYVGVYADYAISGTNAEKRNEFQRMIADCEAGKIDIILTKSISRFARNTVDLLETVRYLKDLGVEIRFEEQNISTMSGDGELMLSILASFAQEESRSISENCKWGIRKRFQSGEIGVANKHILGYRYDEEQKQYVIIPDEAEVVRRIVQMYLDRLSLREICRNLNNTGQRTINGNPFQEAALARIIYNEAYVGDMRRQKTYMTDPITKKKVRNNGELPQYYITDTHEPIINRETYEKVQEERKRRDALLNPTYCFSKKIKCGTCGRYFTRSKKRKTEAIWICRAKKEHGVTCSSMNFDEGILKSSCAEALNMNHFDEEAFKAEIQEITVMADGNLAFRFYDGRKTIQKVLHLNKNKHIFTYTKAFHEKIHCAVCGCPYHHVNCAGKFSYWYCTGSKRKNIGCIGKSVYTDYHLRQISAYVMDMDDFNEKIFNEQIEEILVLEDGSLEYYLKDGGVKTWQRT